MGHVTHLHTHPHDTSHDVCRIVTAGVVEGWMMHTFEVVGGARPRGPCLVGAISHTNESYDIGVSHCASHMAYDIDVSYTTNESHYTHI